MERLLGYAARGIALYLRQGMSISQALDTMAERLDPTPPKGTPERDTWEQEGADRLTAEAAATAAKPVDEEPDEDPAPIAPATRKRR